MANKPNTADQKLIAAAAHAGMSVEEFTAMVFGAVNESEDATVRQVAQVASNRIVQSMTAEDKLVVRRPLRLRPKRRISQSMSRCWTL